jgi:hypothetical protein
MGRRSRQGNATPQITNKNSTKDVVENEGDEY